MPALLVWSGVKRFTRTADAVIDTMYPLDPATRRTMKQSKLKKLLKAAPRQLSALLAFSCSTELVGA